MPPCLSASALLKCPLARQLTCTHTFIKHIVDFYFGHRQLTCCFVQTTNTDASLCHCVYCKSQRVVIRNQKVFSTVWHVDANRLQYLQHHDPSVRAQPSHKSHIYISTSPAYFTSIYSIDDNVTFHTRVFYVAALWLFFIWTLLYTHHKKVSSEITTYEQRTVWMHNMWPIY